MESMIDFSDTTFWMVMNILLFVLSEIEKST